MDTKKADKLVELLNNILDTSWLIDKMDIKEFRKNIENNKTKSWVIINTQDSKKHEFVWKVMNLFINTDIFSSARSIVEFSMNELSLDLNVPSIATLYKRNKPEVIWHIAVAILQKPNKVIEQYLDVLSKIDTKKVKTEMEFKNTWSDLIRNVL